MKVLITSGATREKIDDIRFISNISSGKTGSKLASIFEEKGAEVTFVYGRGSLVPKECSKLIEYSDFKSLNKTLEKQLSEESFSIVIHLAAVSDYSVDYVELNGENVLRKSLRKIDSKADLKISFKKNFKIIKELKRYCSEKNKNALIVPFKLTNTDSEVKRMNAIKELFKNEGVEYVVHNDFSELEQQKRVSNLYNNNNAALRLEGYVELGNKLYDICVEKRESL